MGEGRLEDADPGFRIDQDASVRFDVPELARRGVVEGEDDRRGPGGGRDASVEQIGEADQPVALRAERLEDAAAILGRPLPALLRGVDLVILDAHQAAELDWRAVRGGCE